MYIDFDFVLRLMLLPSIYWHLCKWQLLGCRLVPFIIIQFWSWFIPVNGGGWIYPTLAAISPTPTSSCLIQGILLFQTNALALFLHLRLPHLLWSSLLPFALHFNAFIKICPSSLLNTCPYHLTPFAFAISHLSVIL